MVKILFVIDNASIRNGMFLVLETMHEMQLVGMADNGAMAIKLCEENQPDIVLIDLGMPEMNGLITIRLIRKRFPNIQIVAMTGFNGRSLNRQVIHAGAKVFLSKDATIDEMIHVLRGVASDIKDRPIDLSN